MTVLFAASIVVAAFLAFDVMDSDDVAGFKSCDKSNGSATICPPPRELVKRVYLSSPVKPFSGYPTLVFRETDGYSFTPGKANLSSNFQELLSSKITSIVVLAEQIGADRIEVVGHTDEQPLKRSYKGNLDERLFNSTQGREEPLIAGDNVGLGMSRAISVSNFLRQAPELRKLTIIPLSAGPLIDTDGRLSQGGGGSDERRRRIELRLLKLQSNQ